MERHFAEEKTTEKSKKKGRKKSNEKEQKDKKKIEGISILSTDTDDFDFTIDEDFKIPFFCPSIMLFFNKFLFPIIWIRFINDIIDTNIVAMDNGTPLIL